MSADDSRKITGGAGGIRTRGGFYPSHAFQACDLNRSSTSPVRAIVAVGIRGYCGFCVLCTIFMADVIKLATSVILLGTIRVVLAFAATRL